MRPTAPLALLALLTALALAATACGPPRGGGGDDDDEENNAVNNAANNAATNNTTPIQPPCSLDEPEGRCTQGYTCLDGACVSLGLVCSEGLPFGECPFEQRCVAGRCFLDADLCSAANPIGVCDEGQFCNQGFCTTREPCGPAEPFGSCDEDSDTKVCFMGECRERDTLCGPFNTEDGECPPSLACLAGVCHLEDALCSLEERGGRCPPEQTCSGGVCMPIAQACSLANPSGACANDFRCFDGFCRDESELCSAANPFGFCEGGLSCIEGECRVQDQECSVTVFDGLCPEGLRCSAGNCVGPVACDPTFLHGSCPEGQTCLCDAHINGSGACRSCGRCSDAWVAEEASADQRSATARANALRNSIGLWSINMDQDINEATQAHADYLVNVGTGEGHHENNPQSPYFTGLNFWDRMAAAGYQGNPASEVISYTGDPVGAVDGLVATVYHREPFFDPHVLEMGYGGAIGPQGAADVINFGGAANACLEPRMYIYPPNGATDVDVSWDGLESPTPPAPPGGYPSGPILSVHGTHAIEVETHRILLGDAEQEHTELSSLTDPNGAVGENHYFLYTHKPLRANTEYVVEVIGRHAGAPFHLRWSFTTK